MLGEDDHLLHLEEALRLAARGRFRTSPNPMVGAVVVKEGDVVGTGYHRQVGGDHAEVEALEQAGSRARGATLLVTLEPCCHHGRTPPCVHRVRDSGIRKVVACHRDPDPRVAGEGFRLLRQAGIEVTTGSLVREAVRLNLPYLVAKVKGRPEVTLKWAMSLDGRIATASGQSQWISSAAGREWALERREDHDGILVGSGTALADDPSLNRRLNLAPGPNLRVVMDRRLRVRPHARLFQVEGPVVIYTETKDRDRRRALKAQGAQVVVLPRVEPGAVLDDLGRRGVQSLLVEGGAEILAAFVEAGLFDRVALCCAPLLIGGQGAPGPLAGKGSQALDAAPRLEEIEVEERGEDLILTGYRRGCLRDLLQSVGA